MKGQISLPGENPIEIGAMGYGHEIARILKIGLWNKMVKKNSNQIPLDTREGRCRWLLSSDARD